MRIVSAAGGVPSRVIVPMTLPAVAGSERRGRRRRRHRGRI